MASISELLDLTGKTAIVTGGAMGIGAAISCRLAEAGAFVLIADIADAATVVGDIVRAGGRAEAITADLAGTDQCRRVVEQAVTLAGGVDVLVNNAGIFPFVRTLTMTEADWDRVLDLNLRGAFFMAQAAANAMIAGGRHGSIINIASVDAIRPTGALAHYDASKGGLVMLTKALALDLARDGIRVNAIAPGGIATPGAAAAGAAMQEAGLPEATIDDGLIRRVPLGRWGVPDDIAMTTLFLASAAASYITGEVIVIDGGLLLT